MQKYRFYGTSTVYDAIASRVGNHIRMKFVGNQPENLNTGFEELNETNLLPQGDFANYKYIYKAEDDGTVEFTTDSEDVYVAPVPVPEPPTPTEATVTFVADDHCSLDSTTPLVLPIGTDLSSIVAPNVKVEDVTYEFDGWNPAIEGTLDHDITFMATTSLKPEFTLESRISALEESVLELADQYYSSLGE